MGHSILVWNCCGAKKPGFLRAFKFLLRNHDVCLAALLETQISGRQAEEVCRKTGLMFYRVEAMGRRGGIWLLWSHSISVRILEAKEEFIHVETSYLNQAPSLMTVVYALPPVTGLEQYWDQIADLAPNDQTPWLVAGDFNSIAKIEERKGGSGQFQPQDRRLGEWINKVGLIDLGFTGSPFTWSRPTGNGSRISKRLDRALCNESWQLRWTEGKVRHLARYQSDHSPLLIIHQDVDVGNYNRRPFRFQAAWLTHSSFIRVVQSKWEPNKEIEEALEALRTELKSWNKKVFGNIEARKKRLLARLQGLQWSLDNRPNKGLSKLDVELRAKLDEVLQQEEILWLQKSRESWITNGDRNTKYFHTTTMVRRRQNKIEGLKNQNGEWIFNKKNLEELALQFYEALYTEDPSTSNSQLPRGRFPPWSENDLKEIVNQISVKEVRRALFSMAPTKAPGIDGFQAIFFQRCWELIKPNLLAYIQEAFSTGYVHPKLNETLLILIPKVQPPQTIQQFRLISLYNVPYKILTKILVHRLQAKLPVLISQAQGSFVPGRQISDNVIILQEVIHSMRQKKGAKGWMAIKLDLEKAYDRLRWAFIQETLEEAGLPSHFTKLIMNCVTGAKMRVVWNGEMSSEFIPSRGLRQGDPLSPYLFVLCMERLAHWIQDAACARKWKPLRITRQGPDLTHLFFADDVVLFAEASPEQARLIKEGLAKFCATSGQKVSESKSRIFFSSNTSKHRRQEISESLGIQSTSDLGRYLGIPTLHSRVNRDTFQYIVEKAQSRLTGWKSKQLTMAGRVTLTRSVLNTLPFYAMQMVSLPVGICDKLDKISRDFIWGESVDVKRAHLVQWKEVCLPKALGGLGLRTARDANKAFLTKLGWRFITNPETTWAQVLKNKYVKQSQNPVSSKCWSKRSAIWAGIMRAAELVQQGTKWSIGDGSNALFWEDEWVTGEGALALTHPQIPPDLCNRRVKDFWDGNKGWKWDILENLLSETTKLKLMSTVVGEQGLNMDSFSWKFTDNGEFSMNSAYLQLVLGSSNAPQEESHWNNLWRLKLPEKLRLFIWFCLKGKLMTNNERHRRNMSPNPYCPYCQNIPETIIHLLRDCPKARPIWLRLVPQQYRQCFFNMNRGSWLQLNIRCTDKIESLHWNLLFGTAIWWIWKWRNNFIFDRATPPFDKPRFIRDQVKEFETAWTNNMVVVPTSLNVPSHETAWQCPQPGTFKLNTDGSSKGNPGRAGGGGVIRDSTGHWCRGFAIKLGHSNAISAESWALWKGLQLVTEGKFSPTIVETDSATAFRYITEGVDPSNPLAVLVSKSRDLIRRHGQIEVKLIGRSCNRVADWLSNFALNIPGGSTTLELPPEGCCSILQEDAFAHSSL